MPLATPEPSTESFTPAQIATGNKFFYTYCTICHGGPVNPDLRRSALLKDKDSWQKVVIGGALAERHGELRAYLKPEEAEGIRAFVNQQAKDLLKEEGGK